MFSLLVVVGLLPFASWLAWCAWAGLGSLLRGLVVRVSVALDEDE